MAVAVDRGSLLIDQVIKSLRPARDVLLAIGLYYSVKNVIKLACQGFKLIINQLNQPPSFHWHPKKIWSRTHSKYAVVVLHTDIHDPDRLIDLWNRANFRILVDGAANTWFQLIKDRNEDIVDPIPNLVTGDFDSINSDVINYYASQEPICKVITTPDQDFTDFTKALQELSKCISSNTEIEEIYAYAEYDGRLDHIFGLFETLYQAKNIPSLPPVFLVSSGTTDWLLQPGIHFISLQEKEPRNVKSNLLNDEKSYRCGIIPLGEPCKQIHTSGLKWNIVKSQILAFGTLISTSNTFSDDIVTIRVGTPVIWTMKN